MRKTHATVQMVKALLDDPDAKHWGYDLRRRAGVRSGVLYPILSRMLEAGWLTDGWETPPPEGRPPRRYYKLTKPGREVFAALLVEASRDPRFSSLNLDSKEPGA